MIRVIFRRAENALVGVSLTGHAGYAETGGDIVCAAVTSAAQMTANGITEILGIDMPVTVKDNLLEFVLPRESDPVARVLLESLLFHLEILALQYENTIQITVLEV